jgi:hypothetical protein
VTSVDVRLVGAEAWETWRDIRLRSLRDSPDAFGSTYAREAAFAESHWTDRLAGDEPAVLAFHDSAAVAMGAGWVYEPGKLMIVAMWTAPAARSTRGTGSSRAA